MTILRLLAVGAAAAIAALALTGPSAAESKRVQVTGEVVDPWCSITGIMFAEGTAHHQCAIWCAVGGIPVSIKTKDGDYYAVLKLGDDKTSAPNDTIVKIQSHQVTVDGVLHERDGVKYLFVQQVADDKGVVNLTHEEYGIVPFGN